MATNRIPVGIIGTGSMGRSHIRSLLAIGEFQITAVCDPHPPSLEEARKILPEGCREYADYREMLAAGGLEAAIVATPNRTHTKIAIECLEGGLHVLSEKPMATTVPDCDAMIAAAGKADNVLQIGLELRHAPIYKKMHEVIREGEIGDVRMMWCHEFRAPFLQKVNDWIIQDAWSGGTLVEKDCHHFDLFNWMIGVRPRRVCALGGADVAYREKGKFVPHKRPGTVVDVLDNAWVVTEYENGARACLGLSMFSAFGDPGLKLGALGDEGTLRSDETDMHLDVWSKSSPEKVSHHVPIPEEIEKQSHSGAVYYEHLAFAESIRRGASVVVDAETARWSVIVGLAAEEAVREGRVVNISEIETGPA